MQSGKVLSDRSDSKSCPSETKIFESLALSNKAVTCQQPASRYEVERVRATGEKRRLED